MFREASMIYLNSNTIWILDSEAKQNNGFASSPRSAQAIGVLWSLSSEVPPKRFPHRLGKRQGKETCPPSTKPSRHGGPPQSWPQPGRAEPCPGTQQARGSGTGLRACPPTSRGCWLELSLPCSTNSLFVPSSEGTCFTFSAKGSSWYIRGNSLFTQDGGAQTIANSRRQIRLRGPHLAVVLSRSGALWNYVLL